MRIPVCASSSSLGCPSTTTACSCGGDGFTGSTSLPCSNDGRELARSRPRRPTPTSADRASGDRPPSEIRTSASSSRAMLTRPRTPHLVWSATTTQPLRRRDQRLVGLGLEQVRRREARVLAHSVHAHEEHVDVERTERRRRDRADERVGGRPDAAREDDGQVGPLLGVEDVGDRQRVRDDRQVRACGAGAWRAARSSCRRRARPPDRARRARSRPGRSPPSPRPAGGTSPRSPARRRSGATASSPRRAPSRPGPHCASSVEVAPNGHLGHSELLRQFAHAHRAVAANLLDDHHLTLSGEHRGLRRLESMRARDRAGVSHTN